MCFTLPRFLGVTIVCSDSSFWSVVKLACLQRGSGPFTLTFSWSTAVTQGQGCLQQMQQAPLLKSWPMGHATPCMHLIGPRFFHLSSPDTCAWLWFLLCAWPIAAALKVGLPRPPCMHASQALSTLSRHKGWGRPTITRHAQHPNVPHFSIEALLRA